VTLGEIKQSLIGANLQGMHLAAADYNLKGTVFLKSKVRGGGGVIPHRLRARACTRSGYAFAMQPATESEHQRGFKENAVNYGEKVKMAIPAIRGTY